MFFKYVIIIIWSYFYGASQVVLVVKDPSTSARDSRDPGSISGSGRSPGEGNGHPLQCSCLQNPMDRGAWQAGVHGVKKGRAQLATEHTQQQYKFVVWRAYGSVIWGRGCHECCLKHGKNRITSCLCNVRNQLEVVDFSEWDFVSDSFFFASQ